MPIDFCSNLRVTLEPPTSCTYLTISHMRNRSSRFYSKLTFHDRSHVGFHANCRFTLKYGIALYIKLKTVTNAAKPTLTQDSTLRLNCSILCSVVWGSCRKTFSKKLQKPQNRAARVLTFSNYEADVPQLLKKSKLG